MTLRNGALDWLRALAIAIVLVCHLTNAFAPQSDWRGITSLGGHGVDLFFVLSGWLLGSQLFREVERTGSVDVPRFWFRRWLRTLPAYYAVLFATFAQFALQGRPERIDWRYLFFLQNYFEEIPYLGVTWSLCVEEHFYLAVAPAIWLAFRWRFGLPLVLTVTAGLVLAHIMGWYRTHHTYDIYASHIRWEQCATGVVLAWVAQRRPHLWQSLARGSGVFVVLSLLMIAIAMLNRTIGNWVLPGWGVFGWALIFGAWVLRAAVKPSASAPLLVRFVALRAYALYLVHIEAIQLSKRLALPTSLQVLIALALAFVLAEILYQVVEHPFTQLRERWQRSRAQREPAPPTATPLKV